MTDITPSAPLELAAWMGSAAFALWLLLLVLKLGDRIRGRAPEPPNNLLSQTTQHLDARLVKCESRLDKMECAIRASEDKVLLAGSLRGKELYAQIGDVRKELKADIKLLEDKIEAMPERVVNLLRSIKTLNNDNP